MDAVLIELLMSVSDGEAIAVASVVMLSIVVVFIVAINR